MTEKKKPSKKTMRSWAHQAVRAWKKKQRDESAGEKPRHLTVGTAPIEDQMQKSFDELTDRAGQGVAAKSVVVGRQADQILKEKQHDRKRPKENDV